MWLTGRSSDVGEAPKERLANCYSDLNAPLAHRGDAESQLDAGFDFDFNFVLAIAVLSTLFFVTGRRFVLAVTGRRYLAGKGGVAALRADRVTGACCKLTSDFSRVAEATWMISCLGGAVTRREMHRCLKILVQSLLSGC